jgi:hypothetical protein
MEFRSNAIASQDDAETINYLTKDLRDPAAARVRVEELIGELGHSVSMYPDWHPILTAPTSKTSGHVSSLSQVHEYRHNDHTRSFVRGFVTCPYSEERADKLVNEIRDVQGLTAHRLSEPLYSDEAYPVVVEAYNVELEADGTIRSRDALAWFVQQTAKSATDAQVAETWWNMRSCILGRPHGSRSSLFVNQYTGGHMRKILEALNNSGMFGEIKEESLDMLSQKKRNAINETLIRTAIECWDKKSAKFDFELRGEICKTAIRDTWEDRTELSVSVEVGDGDLYISGFYYADGDKTTYLDPRGKRATAEKFI